MIIPILFIIFLIISFSVDFESGKEIGFNFYKFFKSMISFLPAVFILIGVFEVWVKRELIEKHMGEESGIRGYFWGIVLSATAVGGLYTAFPIAYSIYKKGARLSVIFTYIGAAAVARVPMIMYEASYVGLKFTIIRITVSLPLIIISAIILEKYLKNKNFEIKKPEKEKKGS